MSVPEFLDSMHRKNRQNSISSNSIPQTNNTVKSDSRSISESQYINIVFFTEEKLTTNVKRRYENQVVIFNYTFLYFNKIINVILNYRF